MKIAKQSEPDQQNGPAFLKQTLLQEADIMNRITSRLKDYPPGGTALSTSPAYDNYAPEPLPGSQKEFVPGASELARIVVSLADETDRTPDFYLMAHENPLHAEALAIAGEMLEQRRSAAVGLIAVASV
jgi:hypothetical protein